jgi:hypothetical protein
VFELVTVTAVEMGLQVNAPTFCVTTLPLEMFVYVPVKPAVVQAVGPVVLVLPMRFGTTMFGAAHEATVTVAVWVSSLSVVTFVAVADAVLFWTCAELYETR